MSEPTPPTPLAVLARIIPQTGRGIDTVTLLALCHEAGVDVDLERLSRVLAYLVAGEMVVVEAGRYRQAGRVW